MNQIITTNYLKDFIHSENTVKNKYNEPKYINQQTQLNSTIPKKNINNQADKMNQINNINYNHNYNYQNLQNKIATPSNNSLRNYDSSKNFSTKNLNGKKIIFNDKQDNSTTKFEGMYRQLNNQAANNNLINVNYLNNDKTPIVSRTNKISNTSSQRPDSNKIRNLISNKTIDK